MPSTIFFLAMITLLAGLGIGAWGYLGARKAKEKGETSALAQPKDQ